MRSVSLARRIVRFFTAAIAALCIAATSACSPSQSADRLEVITVDGRRHTFHVELASKPADRERGLMYRQSLAPDAGMLFDFGEDRMVSMWMKNTFIPLDMVFIARDGLVVTVAANTIPQALDTISSGRPVRAVLEIGGGEAARLGIGPGARVVHPVFAQVR